MSEPYRYDSAFYQYINRGAVHSAEIVLPRLTRLLPITSVVDVGCGQGAWLSVWQRQGVADITGIDGDYVDRGTLLIPAERFLPRDLTVPIEIGRRFDVVQCLEVAEHLPASAARGLVSSLASLGDVVLFSAATPGQGGENHINEQDYEYWRALFAERGYIACDPLRAELAGNVEVEPWYRYNVLLYVASTAIERLPPAVAASKVPDERRIPDVAPSSYRLRRRLIAMLPPAAATGIAIIKKHCVRLMHGRGS